MIYYCWIDKADQLLVKQKEIRCKSTPNSFVDSKVRINKSVNQRTKKNEQQKEKQGLKGLRRKSSEYNYEQLNQYIKKSQNIVCQIRMHEKQINEQAYLKKQKEALLMSQLLIEKNNGYNSQCNRSFKVLRLSKNMSFTSDQLSTQSMNKTSSFLITNNANVENSPHSITKRYTLAQNCVADNQLLQIEQSNVNILQDLYEKEYQIKQIESIESEKDDYTTFTNKTPISIKDVDNFLQTYKKGRCFQAKYTTPLSNQAYFDQKKTSYPIYNPQFKINASESFSRNEYHKQIVSKLNKSQFSFQGLPQNSKFSTVNNQDTYATTTNSQKLTEQNTESLKFFVNRHISYQNNFHAHLIRYRIKMSNNPSESEADNLSKIFSQQQAFHSPSRAVNRTRENPNLNFERNKRNKFKSLNRDNSLSSKYSSYLQNNSFYTKQKAQKSQVDNLQIIKSQSYHSDAIKSQSHNLKLDTLIK